MRRKGNCSIAGFLVLISLAGPQVAMAQGDSFVLEISKDRKTPCLVPNPKGNSYFKDEKYKKCYQLSNPLHPRDEKLMRAVLRYAPLTDEAIVSHIATTDKKEGVGDGPAWGRLVSSFRDQREIYAMDGCPYIVKEAASQAKTDAYEALRCDEQKSPNAPATVDEPAATR